MITNFEVLYPISDLYYPTRYITPKIAENSSSKTLYWSIFQSAGFKATE